MDSINGITVDSWESDGSPQKMDFYTNSKPDTPESLMDVSIIDIRGDSNELDLKKEILSGLKPQRGPKTLPTLLLYDEKGLQLFEKACAGFEVFPTILRTNGFQNRSLTWKSIT